MWRRGADRDAGTVAMASSYEPASSGVPSNRGPVGVIILAVALFAAAIVPPALDRFVEGTAVAAPLPEPPPIGSCVHLPPQQPPEVVSCDEPHDGEITMTWKAGEFPKANEGAEPRSYTVAAVNGGGTRFTYFECFGWNSSYVGESAFSGDLTTPETLFSGGMVYGTPDQRFSRLSWSACSITPSATGLEYSGSIRAAGARPTTARPDVYGACLARPDFGASELAYASCALPHRVEPIAMDSDLGTSIPPDQALAECRQLVQQVTGATDPTYGGQLLIEVQPVRTRTLSLEQYSPAELAAQDCVVELANGGSLVGSLVAHGDAPLPVAG